MYSEILRRARPTQFFSVLPATLRRLAGHSIGTGCSRTSGTACSRNSFVSCCRGTCFNFYLQLSDHRVKVSTFSRLVECRGVYPIRQRLPAAFSRRVEVQRRAKGRVAPSLVMALAGEQRVLARGGR